MLGVISHLRSTGSFSVNITLATQAVEALGWSSDISTGGSGAESF